MVKIDPTVVSDDKLRALLEGDRKKAARLRQDHNTLAGRSAALEGVVSNLRDTTERFRNYEPMLEELAAAGFGDLAGLLGETIDEAGGDQANPSILVMLIKAVVARETGVNQATLEQLITAVRDEGQEAIGRVHIDVRGLTSLVEGIRSDVTAAQSDIKSLQADGKGYKAGIDGHEIRICNLESRPAGGSSDGFNGKAFVVTTAVAWLIYGFALYVGSGWEISIPQIGVAFALAFVTGLFVGYFYDDKKSASADKLPMRARVTGKVDAPPSASIPPAPATTIPPADQTATAVNVPTAAGAANN